MDRPLAIGSSEPGESGPVTRTDFTFLSQEPFRLPLVRLSAGPVPPPSSAHRVELVVGDEAYEVPEAVVVVAGPGRVDPFSGKRLRLCGEYDTSHPRDRPVGEGVGIEIRHRQTVDSALETAGGDASMFVE